MKKVLCLTSVMLFVGGGASALSVTPTNGNSDNGASLVSSLLGPSSGLTVTGTSYIGADNQAAIYSDFNLSSSDAGEPTLTLDDGILLTSGNAGISDSNTSPSFTGNNGLPGDADTDAALAGFPQFDGTNDANVLEFTFTTEPGITSVSTDFVFGSEEFDEFPSFVDSFTFFVDGVNYAAFPNGDPIVQQGTTQGFFNDNVNGSYGVEYDGLSDVLTVTGILDTTLTEHTIKIVVADDGDSQYDSGVFLTSLSGGTATGGGGIGQPPGAIPLPASGILLFAAMAGGAVACRRKKTA